MVISVTDEAGRAHSYARTAGILGALSILAGGFGEAYVPGMLVVPADAAATATKMLASESLFRWGFAAYLVEALCDTGLTLLFYLLLRVVRDDVALLAVFFRLIATAGFAVAQVFYFSAFHVIGGAAPVKGFASDQRNELAMLLLRMNGYGQSVFCLFYGVGSILLGYLIYRSGFLPGYAGILLALSGAGFAARTFTSVLAPAYSTPLLLAPAGVAVLVLTVQLLVKGVDTDKWREKAALATARRPV